jgi:YD repeat-containing protein
MPGGYSEVADSTQVRRFFGNAHGTLDKWVEGGAVTTATYRNDGHLTSRMDPVGATTAFERDTRGRVLKITDPLGRMTAVVRDGNGLPVEVTDPMGGVVRITNGLRQITELSYDLAGQLLKRAFDDGSLDELAYNGCGELIEAKGPGGDFRFERDAAGRVVCEVQIVGGKEVRVASAYDVAGERVGRKTSVGHTERVTRGVLGERARTVLDGVHVVDHRVDMLGREIARALPGGGWLQSTYDAIGRLERRRAGGAPDSSEEAQFPEPRANHSPGRRSWIHERQPGEAVEGVHQLGQQLAQRSPHVTDCYSPSADLSRSRGHRSSNRRREPLYWRHPVAKWQRGTCGAG